MSDFDYTGLKLTESFESCRLTPYQDVAGVWTDGWGNTHGVVPGFDITQEKADADLLRNLGDAVACVNAHVEVPIDQQQFDALVDFTFNVGGRAFVKSTMLKYLNQGYFARAALEFEEWDMAGGKHVAGLLRRRRAEEALFTHQEL